MAFMCAVRVASVALVALLLLEKITGDPNGDMNDTDPNAVTPIHAPASYGRMSLLDSWNLTYFVGNFSEMTVVRLLTHPTEEINTGLVASGSMNLTSGIIVRFRIIILGRTCEFEADTLDIGSLKHGLEQAINGISGIAAMLANGFRYGVAIVHRVVVDYFEVDETLMNPEPKGDKKTELLEIDGSRAKHVQFPDSATRDSPSTVNFSTVKSEKLLLQVQRSNDGEHGRRDGNGNCYFIATMLLNNPGRSVGYYTDKLGPNTHLRSPSGGYRLIMQIDCNLVLYKVLDNGALKSMWSSKTDNQGVDCYAYLENNGVLTVRDKDENVLYYSHKTKCGFGESCLLDAALVVEEGKLVLYELKPVKAIWDSLDHP